MTRDARDATPDTTSDCSRRVSVKIGPEEHAVVELVPGQRPIPLRWTSSRHWHEFEGGDRWPHRHDKAMRRAQKRRGEGLV